MPAKVGSQLEADAQAKRLIHDAQALVNGGYLRLLRGR